MVIGQIEETLSAEDLESQLSEALWSLSDDRSLGEAAGVIVFHGGYVGTFAEDGIAPPQRGLVLWLTDGSEFHLTVTKVR
jgi:hypothetical protein